MQSGLQIEAYRLAVILDGPGVLTGIEIGVAPGAVGLGVTRFEADGPVELRDRLAKIPGAGVGRSNVIEKGLASVVMDPGISRIFFRHRPGKRRGAGSAQQNHRE